jgi:hypothetical protein
VNSSTVFNYTGVVNDVAQDAHVFAYRCVASGSVESTTHLLLSTCCYFRLDFMNPKGAARLLAEQLVADGASERLVLLRLATDFPHLTKGRRSQA